jgi:HSP20 family protein
MTQQWSVLRTMTQPALPPPRLTADVYETAGGEAYVIEVAVPGLKADEIVVEATADGVTVSTKPPPGDTRPERKYLQREQWGQPMSRVFDFPVEIDPDNVQARLQHGVLRIEVPKAVAARRKVIGVQAA